MDIKDIHTLTEAIESVAPIYAGWALTDRVGDLKRFAEARRRKLMYREFEIPKRSGGVRKITAPTGKLKDIQNCLSVILAPYYQEPDCAHGFTSGRSVATNAQSHIGRNYILNIDLKDFFPTITYTRVMRSLDEMGFNEENQISLPGYARFPCGTIISRCGATPCLKALLHLPCFRISYVSRLTRV